MRICLARDSVDSDTIDHVGPRDVGEAFEVRESDKSRAGFKYRVANGDIVPNEGEKWLEGYSDDWQPLRLNMQVAQVKKVLA